MTLSFKLRFLSIYQGDNITSAMDERLNYANISLINLLIFYNQEIDLSAARKKVILCKTLIKIKFPRF